MMVVQVTNEAAEDKQMGRVAVGARGATDSTLIGIREGWVKVIAVDNEVTDGHSGGRDGGNKATW